MKFEMTAGTTRFTGSLKCADDDGTTTLAMMIHSLLKKGSEDHPEIAKAKRIKIEAELL